MTPIFEIVAILLFAALVALLLAAIFGLLFGRRVEKSEAAKAVHLCGQCQRYFQGNYSPASLSDADTAPRAAVAIPDHPRH